MPPTIAARWMTCDAALHRLARLDEVAQVAGVDLAALAHPLRRLALVGDADLVVGVAQQAADDRRADRAGAAGDEDAVHVTVTGAPPARSSARSARRRRRRPGRRRSSSRGRRRAPRRRPAPRSRAARRAAELRWLVATTTASAPATASSSGCVGVATCGSWTATSASSRSSRRMSLWASESRSSSVSPLKASPRTAILRPSSVPSAALEPLDEEQRHRLVDARDGEQHARRVGALLGEGEVLAQARPGGEPRLGHAAARVVAVDEVDDLEDVRAVLLAVHHQQVGQRELRVAQDVRPDLRELGLDRRGLHDRRAEDAEQRADALAGALADAADDARQRVDLLEEPARRRCARARGRRRRPRRSRSRGAWRGSRRRSRSCPARSSSAGRSCGPRAGGGSRSSSAERMSEMSISMCENDGVPSVMTMCSACAASATRSDTVSVPAA